MTDRPILFSAPMVRALLAGTKTQTRRLLRMPEHLNSQRAYPDPGLGAGGYLKAPTKEFWGDDEVVERVYPFCEVGDRLWVRETWAPWRNHEGLSGIDYRATRACNDWNRGWKPSIYMPRWASRLTLTVTDVRVQRLQDITMGDVEREGVTAHKSGGAAMDAAALAYAFKTLWDALNGKRAGAAWADNPWIVAISFTVAHRNIDDTSTKPASIDTSAGHVDAAATSAPATRAEGDQRGCAVGTRSASEQPSEGAAAPDAPKAWASEGANAPDAPKAWASEGDNAPVARAEGERVRAELGFAETATEGAPE